MYLSPVYCDLTLQVRLFAWGGREIGHTQQGCSSTDLALMSTNPHSDKEKPRAAASASTVSSQHHFMKLWVLEVIT